MRPAVSIRAQFGALVDSSANHVRVADVQVRLGDPKLDNTHGDHRGSAVNSLQLPLSDDREALARSLWLATNTGYGTALDNYLRVKTEAAGAGQGRGHLAGLQPGDAAGRISASRRRRWWWTARRGSSGCGRSRRSSASIPDVYQNVVMLTVQNETDYFASSEGSRVVTPHLQARLVVFAVTRADDGMDLFRAQTFEAETVEGLPAQAEMEAAMRELGKSLEALRKAPVTEPFDGPAILVRTRRGGLLPRGAGPPARGPAPARRRGGPDLYQGCGQGGAAELSFGGRRSDPDHVRQHLAERQLRV